MSTFQSFFSTTKQTNRNAKKRSDERAKSTQKEVSQATPHKNEIFEHEKLNHV